MQLLNIKAHFLVFSGRDIAGMLPHARGHSFAFTLSLLGGLLTSGASTYTAEPKSAESYSVGDRVKWDFGSESFPGTVESIDPRTGWLKIKLDNPKFGDRVTKPPSRVKKIAGDKPVAEAAADADNPFEVTSPAADKTAIRTWTDASGKHTIEGSLVKSAGGKVTLKRKDGQEITLPLEKLSADDQKFLASGSGEGGNGGSANSGTAGDGPAKDASPIDESKLIPADTADARVVDVSPTAEWSYEPVSASPVKSPRVQMFLASREPLEKPVGVTLVPELSKAVITWLGAGSKNATIEVCDLSAGGHSKSGAFAAQMLPLATSPDLRRVVACSLEGPGKQDTLFLYDVDNQRVKLDGGWRPYGSKDSLRDDVEWAYFLDYDNLFTLSKSGGLILWDLSKMKPVYQVAKIQSHRPAFSAQDKYMAFAVRGGIAIIESRTGNRVGFLESKETGAGQLAFDPSGNQLALSRASRLQIWDLNQRAQTGDFDWDGRGSDSLDWVDGQHVLVDGKWVVDVPHRVLVWTYEHTTRGTMHGDRYWFLDLSNLKKPLFGSAIIPPPEAIKLVDGVAPDSMVQIQPGQTVSLDVQLGTFQQHRDLIYNDLKAKLLANGMTLADGSDIKVSVTVNAAPPKEVTYRQFRTRKVERHTVTPQQTVVEYQVRGKTVWIYKHSFQPMHFRANPGESIEQALARVTQESVAETGKHTRLPRFLAVLPAGRTAGRSAHPDTR